MTTAAPSVRAQPERTTQAGYPADNLRFDWRFTFLASLFVGGLMVDGWAHFHGQVDDSFFTPWHFLFYSAFGMVALFLGYHQYRNVSKGHAWRQALPRGYWLSLVGVTVFAMGGVGDLIWHTLFGIESGSEALLSPSHITLAIGMGLVVTGPLRAAWIRNNQHGWRTMFPALMSASLFLLMLAFFTGYANPIIMPAAGDFGGGDIEVFDPNDELYVMNADGTGQTRLTMNPEVNTAMGRFSPDGSQIAYAQGDLEAEIGESAIFVMDADGKNKVQLADMAGREFQPVWSPDGTQIAFLHDTTGNSDLYVVDVDGGNLRQITSTPDDDEALPAWSPDGSQFALTVFAGDTTALYLVDAESGERTLLAEDALTSAWSPDGSQIAFGANRDNTLDVYVAEADGSNPTRLTNSNSMDAFPAWSPDGSEIIFVSGRDGTLQVYRMPATGEIGAEPAVNLTRNPSVEILNPTYSPDGSQILYHARAQSQQGGGDTSTQDAGVTAIQLQTALMAGVVILLARRWSLPFGALMLVLTVSTLLITVMSDLYIFVPGAVIAGLVADVLARWLKPSSDDRNGLFLFAFLVPVVYYALYMLTVQLAFGIGWSIHVWTGAIVLAGMVGLLLSFITLATNRPTEQAA